MTNYIFFLTKKNEIKITFVKEENVQYFSTIISLLRGIMKFLSFTDNIKYLFSILP